MANTIKIKRSAVTATPTTLAEGELAYSELSGNLFIGTAGANLEKIGGNTDVLKLNGIEAGAQVNTVDSVNGLTGAVSLGASELDDVTITAIATGDVLQWNVGGFWENVAASTVGVTDHGNLTGLADDDHTQYVLVDGTRAITGDLTVNGDLTVGGTLTSVNSTNTEIADNIIVLNRGEVGAGVTLGSAGVEIDRGTGFNTGLVFDESVDKWGQTGIDGSPVGTFTAFSLEGHVHAASDVTSGTFDDARIAASNVTQHVGSIDHDALLNFVADEHVAHSGVTLTAGIGLTGGGDITTSRTFDLDLSSLTTITVTNGAADYAVIYQPGSPTGHKKILVNDLLDGGNF